jgi:hypothetical protein
MLVVDPWHWLKEDGSLPLDNLRLRRRMLRIAGFIEYGGSLQPGTMRETLMGCQRRPKGRACPGPMWVVKEREHTLVAHCIACGAGEVAISNWQKTVWAAGMRQPVPVQSSADELH